MKMIKIDGDKLQLAIKKRGYSFKDAGRIIGRSYSYLSTIKYNGVIPEATAYVLQAMLDVPIEEYEIKETQSTSLGDDLIDEAIKKINEGLDMLTAGKLQRLADKEDTK